MTSRPVIDDLSSFWMPFTANRQFKAATRLLESAKGHVLLPQHGRPRSARRLRRSLVRERGPRPR
ncbi:MAG: Omega-amino acid--pyruvate aminotransferase (EC [uncultured Paraburkholderia sp.]|nr:MAG: Omega-amino acid--pyruvate aminotransferase (EC [uncultured Paraburkholderia sp.]